jgi:hypothetical protein
LCLASINAMFHSPRDSYYTSPSFNIHP